MALDVGDFCKRGHAITLDLLGINAKGYTYCRQCGRDAVRASNQANPDTRAKRTAAAYGLTLAAYRLLLQIQGGACAICKVLATELDRNLGVDHDRSCCNWQPTSERPICGNCVRGLLCNNCNRGIGLLRDSEAIVESALDYLKRSKTPGGGFITVENFDQWREALEIAN